LLTWLQSLRKQWVDMRAYEHTNLADIQKWSHIPTGMPLFETNIIFEAYDTNTILQAQGGCWTQREFKLIQQTHYPLSLFQCQYH
jgi:hypothetical protein